MSDLFFLHSAHLPDCRVNVDKYYDGYHTLQFSAKGAVELFYDEQRYLLETPAFWVSYPGPHIRFHPAPGASFWDHRYVAFTGKTVSRWLTGGLLSLTPQRVKSVKKYSRIFDDLLEHAGRPDEWGPLQAACIMERLLLELAEERTVEDTREPWLADVMAHLETEYAPDYETLANEYGFSVSTLRRRFLAVVGTPIHTYALQMRLARARELLSETNMPLKAIAQELGYADPYFFARQFRSSVGVTPITYRKSRQI